ncbi:MAG: SDR family NAD(P)-dependent oxidoreductase [Vicinamibacterales bacterium]
MRNEQKFLLGLIAGVGGAFAASRLARARRAIEFGGRTVVITGGSRGLGLVLARQFAREGARLCLLARDERELDRAKRLLEEEFPSVDVMTLRCDVRQPDDVRNAVARVLAQWVAIDVLINVAGIIQVGPLDNMNTEDFENAMATHFWGPLHTMFETIPSMRRRGFGRIVNISSIGGRVAVPHLAPYSASKFALVGLSDAMRSELAPHGIQVTTVSPGLMRTGSPRNAQIKGQYWKEYAWFALADSIPGLSTSAESAARQIVEACRYGDPELTITLPAKMAVVANAVAPAAVARLLSLGTRLLPAAAGREGNIPRRGRDSESRLAPSAATTLTERAAVLNNEV